MQKEIKTSKNNPHFDKKLAVDYPQERRRDGRIQAIFSFFLPEWSFDHLRVNGNLAKVVSRPALCVGLLLYNKFMKSEDVIKDLNKLKKPEKAKIFLNFFKTGKGQYGEEDKFLGISVPEQRKVAKNYKSLPLSEIQKLLNSKIHEHRFTALEILVMQYEEMDHKNKEKIVKFYLKNTKNINNWDLVDTSAPYILGNYLLGKERDILYKLAKSKNLWERRIAIVSTFAFIKEKDLKDTVKISEILLSDGHDLIQKAVGWMLREAGKKDLKTLLSFLDKHYKKMPRTMLRYSLEKLNPKQKKFYMTK